MPITVPGSSQIISGGTDNYVMTAVDANSVQGEANLTFDGSDLTVATDVGIIFSDSGQKIESDGTDFTIASGAKLNLTPTSDVHIANGTGMVIGHTAQATVFGTQIETQILGTGFADATIVIGRWSANASPASITFSKSRDPVIFDGSYATVVDNDGLGTIYWTADDGVDLATNPAVFLAEVDDASPEENGVGTAFVWKQQPGGGTTAVQETMRIAANGMMTYGGGIARDTGIIFDNAGTDYHIGIDQGNDTLTLSTGSSLDSATGAINIRSNKMVSFGTAPLNYRQVYIGGAFTSGGSGNTAGALYVSSTITGASGDVGYLTGTILSANITTQTTSEDVAIVTQLYLDEPSITDQLGGSNVITNAATLYIAGAPTEAASGNYAMWVDAGVSRFDGDVGIGMGTVAPESTVSIANSGTSTSNVALKLHNSYNNNAAVTGIGFSIIYSPTDTDRMKGAILYAGNGTGYNRGDFVWLNDSVADTNPAVIGDEVMRLTNAGMLLVGDDANANMTQGLTINQGAADDHILAFKSSDVATGLVKSGSPLPQATETDDWLVFSKVVAGTAGGGARLTALAEDESGVDVSLQFLAYGGQAVTTKAINNAQGLIDFIVSEHDGSNALAAITANGNVFSIRAYMDPGDGGGVGYHTRFTIDEDGDVYSPTTNAHIAYSDNYDDAQLIRALDHAKSAAGHEGIIRQSWDDFVQYNEQDLIDARILGAPVAEGGMTNVTQLQRLHNGAIWQGYVKQQEMQEKIDTLENRLLAIEGAK
jgi:hypothetical protein